MWIEWHVDAIIDLKAIATGEQRRIKIALDDLGKLDDPRHRLIPYSGNLKDFWKLHVGNFRLICQIKEEEGVFALIIRVAYRSVAYDQRSVSKVIRRGD